VDEFSPLIGTFCGVGRLPSAIVGTGKQLFLEFVTSEEGPLLGVGFDLRVAHRPGGSLKAPQAGRSNAGAKLEGADSGCPWTFTNEGLGEGPGGEGLFLSPEHWYPPDTNCSYLIRGEPGQVVRLYFPSFKIGRVENPISHRASGDCSESLTIYDDSWANGEKVVKTFCDSFSKPLERHDFVSTSNALFVAFKSRTGSFSGSALQFWAQYDFFDATADGERVKGTRCDEVIAAGNAPGTFRSPRNTLAFKIYEGEEKEEGEITCGYDIRADERSHSRIALSILELELRGSERVDSKCRGDRVEVTDVYGDRNLVVCLTAKNGERREVYSQGPSLHLTLALEAKHASMRYFKSPAPLFVASYEAIHPPRDCGPTAARGGHLTFPFASASAEPASAFTCVWDIASGYGDLSFELHNATLADEKCSESSLEILDADNVLHHRICPGAEGSRIPALKNSRSAKVKLICGLRGSSFRLLWRRTSSSSP